MTVKRIPLAAPVGEREPAAGKDPRLKNCFKETVQEEGKPTVYITKRWGLKASTNTGSVAAGRGIHVWKGNVYVVVGNQLFKNGVDATSSGTRTLDTSTGRVFFAEAADGSGLLLIQDKTELYTYNGTALTKEGDVDIPTPVSGLVVLDQFAFLMNSNAVLSSSAVGDVQTWNADSITAEVKADPGVAISRYINYLVAFGEDTIEFFYDAANPSGSPLSRFEGMSILVGCAAGDTVTLADQKLVFVARSPKGGRYVGMMDKGFEVKRISTNAIDEVLDKEGANISNAYGYHIRKGGKNLYILTLPTIAARTFVADLDEKTWDEWTSDVSGTETYFTGVDAADNDGTVYILDENNGRYYELDPETYQDNSGVTAENILFEVVTKKWDDKNTQNKFMHRLKPIGDLQTSASALNIAWSDDDYKTFSTNRSVDMSNSENWLTRLGIFKRRAFRLQHTANTALRLEALEVNVEQGHYARSG